MTAIDVRGLTRRFGERTAVDTLDLSIARGECFALLGQNGAGKTTTIRMLCCLLAPTSGDALLMGDSVVTSPAGVKRRINLSPQETAIAPNLTVRENLILIARLYGAEKADAAAKADTYMARLGLSDRAKERGKTLSGGLKRRLSIAMALITEPEILFLDEPTLGLDIRARRELWKLVESLKSDMTILLTTHYLEEAEALCDRIAVMHEGRLAALGTARELMTHTDTATFEDAFLALTETEVIA